MIDWDKLEEMRPGCYNLSDDGSRFVNHRKPNMMDQGFYQLSAEDRQTICEYSQLDDSKIVEIYTMEVGHIETKYYADYYPLVFIDECSFYPEEFIKERMEKYVEFMSVVENVQALYDMVADAMMDFAGLGYIFADRSSNNILVNDDFTDVRIIDVVSIAPKTMFLFIVPEDVLINGKFTAGCHLSDKTLRTHLEKHFDRLSKLVGMVEPRTL